MGISIAQSVGTLLTVAYFGGKIVGRLEGIAKNVEKLETLFTRVGNLEQQQAAQKQRCDDRERMGSAAGKAAGWLILLGATLLAAGALGCTYGRYTQRKPDGSTISGAYLSVLQTKSGTLNKTSDTLAIGYNSNSDAAAAVLLQGIRLGQQLAGAAGKAAM
jgi:hypothetical protein